MGYRKIRRFIGNDFKNVHLTLVKSATKNIFAQNIDFLELTNFQLVKYRRFLYKTFLDALLLG